MQAESVPLVRVVVLNHDGGDLVQRSIDHLAATDWPADRLEVVVVDNGSTDGSVERLLERHPGVVVVESGGNLGFPANNLALGDLEGVDYVALVNDDAFVEPGWLAPLVDTLEAEDGLGAACPRILFEGRFAPVEIQSPTSVRGRLDHRELGVRVDGLVVEGEDVWRRAQFVRGFLGPEPARDGERDGQWTDGDGLLRVPVPGEGGVTVRLLLSADEPRPVSVRTGSGSASVEVGPEPQWAEVAAEGGETVVNNVGGRLLEGGYGADRGFLEPDEGQYDDPAEVFSWSGGAVLLRPTYLAEAGLLDPRFFLYYEDTDLAWRGRSLGWRYRYVPTSVVRHVHAASSVEGSSRFRYFTERNRLLMLAKCAPAGMATRAALRFLPTTASYARRDLVAPVLQRRRPQGAIVATRARSFLGFLRLLAPVLVSRRRVRRRQRVPDDELLAWTERA